MQQSFFDAENYKQIMLLKSWVIFTHKKTICNKLWLLDLSADSDWNDSV